MSKIKIFAMGGLNEEGKNMYVVKVDRDIFIFDAGLKYASDKFLGVDYIIPNFDYIKENIKFVMVYRLNLHLGKMAFEDYDKTIKHVIIKKCKEMLKYSLNKTLQSAKVRSA